MSDEIKVTVASYGEGRCLMMTYKDPITGKKVAKTSGETDRTKAERAAAVWQDELNSGRYQAPSKLTWAEFRKRYETEKLTALARRTQDTAGIAMDHLERILNPDKLVKLTPAALSRFQAELRKPRQIVCGEKTTIKPAIKDATVARHLRHIKAALSWAVSMGMLAKVPGMHMPKRSKGAKLMKGRPIAGEEFDRVIAAVVKVRKHDAPAWEWLLHGLWLSGLRMGEAVALTWDEGAFAVDLTGKHPRFRILAEGQKSGRDELLPMTPDFAQWLLETPEADRVGQVFKLTSRNTGRPMTPQEVGRTISVIGKKAGVVVDKAAGKFASCHDLRRSFGTRWASKAMPAVLKRLMRHSSIATTMGYYVDLDADEMASDLWAKYGTATGNTPAVGNTNGNTRPKEATADISEKNAIPYVERDL